MATTIKNPATFESTVDGLFARLTDEDNNETVAGKGTTNIDLSLPKAGWSSGILIIRAIGNNQKKSIVMFTDTTAQGASISDYSSSDRAYLRAHGATDLSAYQFDTSSSNISLRDVYILNATPALRLTFYNNNASTKTLHYYLEAHLRQ